MNFFLGFTALNPVPKCEFSDDSSSVIENSMEFEPIEEKIRFRLGDEMAQKLQEIFGSGTFPPLHKTVEIPVSLAAEIYRCWKKSKPVTEELLSIAKKPVPKAKNDFDSETCGGSFLF